VLFYPIAIKRDRLSGKNKSETECGRVHCIERKKSSGRVLLIYFLEVALMFESSVVLSLDKKKGEN
jgi:hypothetical protein